MRSSTTGAEALGPRRVGRYSLLARIPGGGMTEVWRARVDGAVGPERPLVLKLLPPELAEEPSAVARFLEEAKIALSLSHGNVVSTFEAGRADDGQPFLVMELVHGASLRRVLTLGGPLPAELAALIGRELARALRYTHDHRSLDGRPTPIVHLDVTPENVLLSYEGNVKLGDFGIARAVGELSGLRGPWGKAPYVAPELLSGDPGGPPADLYGLGCVLYEALTGRPPFLGATTEETLALVRTGPAPEPVGEPELDALLTRLLARAPSERLADAAELERALGAWLARRELPPTEAELASLMRERLEPQEGGAGVGSRGERLRTQLREAGLSVEESGTGELAGLGTLPLGEVPDSRADPHGPPEQYVEQNPEPEPAQAPLAAGQAPTDARSPARRLVLPLMTVVLFAAIGFALWAGLGDPALAPGERAPSSAPTDARTPEATPRAASKPTRAGEGAPRPSALRQEANADPELPRGLRAATEAKRPAPGRPPSMGARGAETAVPMPPRPAAAPLPARLRINAWPYAEVRLEGGRALGTTPLRDVEVPSGRQVLLFENPELGLEQRVELELKPGEQRTVGIRLDR